MTVHLKKGYVFENNQQNKKEWLDHVKISDWIYRFWTKETKRGLMNRQSPYYA